MKMKVNDMIKSTQKKNRKRGTPARFAAMLLLVVMVTTSCGQDVEAGKGKTVNTPTVAPTDTPTPTPSPSPSPTPSPSPSPSPTPSPTPTPSPSPTPTISPTPSPEPTRAPGATVTPAPGKAWDDEHVDISWIDPGKPMIAFSFDDGPAAASSDRILDVLEKYHCHATFFYVGDRVKSYKKRVLRAQALGCEIANHSYTHPNLRKLTEEQIRSEIEKCNQVLHEVTGLDRFVVRCPGGNANTLVKNTIDAPIFYWSVDTEDWRSRDCQSVVNKVLGKVRDGDIVLMHEIYGSTADAVEIIIPKLIEQGYQIVSVSELMKAKGISMTTGVVYYNGR